ncbi:MAG: (p)ppGpp synthetase [Tissierellia bacterium]|nr:(p)ppGpp synthetase [Tissierellia bacterium]
MRLEIFEFIDETISIVDGMKDVLEESNRELEYFFRGLFFEHDNILNISSRVKTTTSLKEKIFRNNFYLKYESPEELVANLSDLIGLRIECRFIEDEEDVYSKIVEEFNIPVEDGYYSSKENPNILLNLDDDQPQVQKNGFGIYKIDGKYLREDRIIRFELQIKSLVNVFWGEAEHKVLYKNYKYLLTEDLFRDIMHALKENLIMVDKQLRILYNHLKEMDESNIDKRKEQLEAILSKIIYEIYSDKTKKEFGFVLDYRKSCDIIVSYVLRQNGHNDPMAYDNVYLKILSRLYKIKENDIYLERPIEFEREIQYEDEFCRKIGEAILEIINKDFKWNLFFKIIFQLESGKNAEEFEKFLIFLRDRFLDNLKLSEGLNSRFNEEEKEEITRYIMDLIADCFIKNREIEFINDDNIDNLNKKINIILRKVINYDMWKENINYFTDELRCKLNDYK